MYSPRSIEIAITKKCNLRCHYCSHFSNQYEYGNDLTLAEWNQFFEELSYNKVMKVIISGGEPFLRPDLNEILKGIVKNRMRFCILSNGTLVQDEIIQSIASSNRCDYVQVSLDGFSPISHDICCGKGSFDAAIEGIQILQKYGIPVTIRVTIHRYNVFDLDEIAQFILKELGVKSFSINSASFLGLCTSDNADICLTATERGYAMVSLLHILKKYKNQVHATSGPLAELIQFSRMEKARLNKQDKLIQGGYLSGCKCVWSHCAVRSDGIIVPCILLPHISLGSINKNNFIHIWRTHPVLTTMRDRHKIPLVKFDFCQNCDYIDYCTGNCPAIAWTKYGEIDHPNPDSCLRKFLADGGTLPSVYELQGIL
jgi:SynChlorMet cassette radical SAM/SPASM protein ScmE